MSIDSKCFDSGNRGLKEISGIKVGDKVEVNECRGLCMVEWTGVVTSLGIPFSSVNNRTVRNYEMKPIN